MRAGAARLAASSRHSGSDDQTRRRSGKISAGVGPACRRLPSKLAPIWPMPCSTRLPGPTLCFRRARATGNISISKAMFRDGWRGWASHTPTRWPTTRSQRRPLFQPSPRRKSRRCRRRAKFVGHSWSAVDLRRRSLMRSLHSQRCGKVDGHPQISSVPAIAPTQYLRQKLGRPERSPQGDQTGERDR